MWMVHDINTNRIIWKILELCRSSWRWLFQIDINYQSDVGNKFMIGNGTISSIRDPVVVFVYILCDLEQFSIVFHFDIFLNPNTKIPNTMDNLNEIKYYWIPDLIHFINSINAQYERKRKNKKGIKSWPKWDWFSFYSCGTIISVPLDAFQCIIFQ